VGLPRRLAYYIERETGEEYWDDMWDTTTLPLLLQVAGESRLTGFLEHHIQAGARVLEAGCGLGQYVRYFSERGVDITGVDYAPQAVARHREAYPDSDVRIGDVEQLDFPDDSFDVYISIGLIEHYRDGPAALLTEARRVVKPHGHILLSTPYLNGARLLLARRFRGQMERVRRRGGVFYQWAFSAAELDSVLATSGFRVWDRDLYNVGKGARMVRSLLTPHDKAIDTRLRAQAGKHAAVDAQPTARSRGHRALLAHPISLHGFAHMQVVSAENVV
jgi:SAM-dependent methyltransferase